MIGKRKGKLVVEQVEGDYLIVRCDCGRSRRIHKASWYKPATDACVGCHRRKRKYEDNISSRDIDYWRYNILPCCVGEWRNIDNVLYILQRRGDGQHIIRSDRTRPHGPENSFISDETQSHYDKLCIAEKYYMERGMDEFEAWIKANEVSRTILSRLWSKYGHQATGESSGCHERGESLGPAGRGTCRTN